MARRDWFEWHRPYDDSTSPLAGRLRVVQRYVVEFLDSAPPGEISVVSMCAGQGRDLLEVLAQHPRTPDVTARLVELNPQNAKVAMDAVATAGLTRVEVVTGDASITTAYEAMVPCHLVLACGVFGHVADGDIESMIGHLLSLCAPGATVIWTRGALGFDLRPTIRNWFLEAGFEEIDFTSGEGGWGVGVNRMVVEPQPYRTRIRPSSMSYRAAEDPTHAGMESHPRRKEEMSRPHTVVDLQRRLRELGWRVEVHETAGPFYWGAATLTERRGGDLRRALPARAHDPLLEESPRTPPSR